MLWRGSTGFLHGSWRDRGRNPDQWKGLHHGGSNYLGGKKRKLKYKLRSGKESRSGEESRSRKESRSVEGSRSRGIELFRREKN